MRLGEGGIQEERVMEKYEAVQRCKGKSGSGDKKVGGWSGVFLCRGKVASVENINGVSGSGVSLKTSSFLLVLLCTVTERAVWR